MEKLIKSAQAQIASQLSDSPHNELFSASALKKLIVGTVAAATLAIGGGMPQDAHAADNSVYGKIIGGSIGAFVGAKATKHMTGAERAAVIAGTTAAGTWVGDAVTRQDPNARVVRQQPVRQAQPVYYERDDGWRDQPRAVEVTRSYSDTRRPQNQRQAGPTVLDASAFDMPEVVTLALRSAGNTGLVADGPNDLRSFPEGEQELKKVTESLVKAGRLYGSSARALEDAQMRSGAEGTDKRTRSAESVKESQKLLQNKAEEWAMVRNTLAVRGFDVSEFDDKVRNEMSGLSAPKTYNFRVGSTLSPR